MRKQWSIIGVKTHTTLAAQSDVIWSLLWRITPYSTFIDEEGVECEANESALDATEWVDIPYSPDSQFIPRSGVTEDVLLGWLKTTLGPDKVAEIEASV
jgi:hypothetical protein